MTTRSECSTAAILDDMTRLGIAAGGTKCDNSTPFFSVLNWFRFSGLGGTKLLSSSPGPYQCGTNYPGWYSGSYPNTGETMTVTVCFATAAIDCQYSHTIAISNCSSFYIYGLTTVPVCDARYCTE